MTQLDVASGDSNPTRPSILADELGFAHELVHALVAILFNISRANDITSKAPGTLLPHEWDDLRDYVKASKGDMESQMYEAINLVSSRWPEFVGNLYRPNVKRLSPSQLMREMLPSYASRASFRGINFYWDRGTIEIPMMDLEEHSMRRAFHNVLSNAVKYSYSSIERKLRYIRLHSWQTGHNPDVWAITIENFGIGIENDELSRVFDPQYRGRLARAENTFGAGLGLGEAKKCVEHNGGTFKIQSRAMGTTQLESEDVYLTRVTILLPRSAYVRQT